MRPSFPASLRARLLLWLLLPLGALAALNLWLAFREARTTASRVQDRLLLGSARIIAQQIQYDDGVLEVAIPPAALELFESEDEDRVYYRIASARGALLSGYTELPAPPVALRPEESLAFDSMVRDQPVRVVAYAQPVFAAPAEGPVIIEVAQTFRAHDRMIQEIWAGSLRQGLWMLALASALLGLSLRWGLKGLVALRSIVRNRRPGSLEPLDPGPVPTELSPLVGAINDYVQRLDAQVAQRTRFIDNAAHQLRTPFAVLQTQVNFGLRTADSQQKGESLRAIFQEVRHGTRLVNQLLSLSRAEAGAQHPRPLAPTDLGEMAQRVLEELAGLAQARDIDLGLDPPAGPVPVAATSAMLHELVANLVDNALRYTPPGGTVTVGFRRENDAVALLVEDDGPGIPPADRVRVFERFCRLNEDGAPGCGLGLSIVQEIARALGAGVQLSEPASGQGLLVQVRFPVLPD
ncbi:sensor histidine kinase [Geothrix sp. 21YS21S-4]|uniref:sensor histidine kinase n=1 Tax=Geothrix sp. 21YS21S-4 TaxID=3068889 RepID=UPI0027B963DC|nr:sensor histidine kinase [Geothrix sp. 21YS21S-4]